jgi:hypothetical protein
MATDHNGNQLEIAELRQMLALSDQLGFADDSAKWRREIAKLQARS